MLGYMTWKVPVLLLLCWVFFFLLDPAYANSSSFVGFYGYKMRFTAGLFSYLTDWQVIVLSTAWLPPPNFCIDIFLDITYLIAASLQRGGQLNAYDWPYAPQPLQGRGDALLEKDTRTICMGICASKGAHRTLCNQGNLCLHGFTVGKA